MIQKERALVVQNVAALEQQLNKLNQEGQQVALNLQRSQGAVMAFDRMIELDLEEQSKSKTEIEVPTHSGCMIH